MDIAKEIKRLKKKYNLSIEDIASRIGISGMSIYRYERGAKPQSKFVFRALEELKRELKKSKPQT